MSSLLTYAFNKLFSIKIPKNQPQSNTKLVPKDKRQILPPIENPTKADLPSNNKNASIPKYEGNKEQVSNQNAETSTTGDEKQESAILNAITDTTLKPDDKYIISPDPQSAISNIPTTPEQTTTISTIPTNNGDKDTPSKEPVITQKEQEPDNSAAISAAIAAAVSQLLKQNKDVILSKNETQMQDKEKIQQEESTTNNILSTISANKEPTQNNGEETTPSDACLLYTSPSPRDRTRSRMPSSA